MYKILDTVVIDNAEFIIIQKPATIYAGFKAEADNGDEENSVNTYELFQKGHKNIVDRTTPDTMICLSINYKECNHGNKARRSIMHCQETTNPNQPDGVDVVESPECLMIIAKESEAMWKLTKKITGVDNPIWHMAPFFGLCERLFCNEQSGFVLTPDFSNTFEIEYYNFDGTKSAGISVYSTVKGL